MKKEKKEIITVSGIEIEVVRKPIKNMYLRVCSDGGVRLSAPLFVKKETIDSFARLKRQWLIRRRVFQMQGASQRKPCQSGERIALWGQVYCLRIVESAHGNGVEQKGDEIVLTVKPDGGHALAQKVLDGWLRSRLEEKIAQVRGTLESKTGVLVSEWSIRDMKTKWGSCNIQKKRICLNLKLAQMPERCLIYVMIHELTHLLEAGHNQAFYGYMNQFCPGWQDMKRELAKRAEAFL